MNAFSDKNAFNGFNQAEYDRSDWAPPVVRNPQVGKSYSLKLRDGILGSVYLKAVAHIHTHVPFNGSAQRAFWGQAHLMLQYGENQAARQITCRKGKAYMLKECYNLSILSYVHQQADNCAFMEDDWTLLRSGLGIRPAAWWCGAGVLAACHNASERSLLHIVCKAITDAGLVLCR